MAEISLTQVEADALLGMQKVPADSETRDYPSFGGAVSIPLVSADKRESFSLDLSRGRVEILRVKYQNRARQVLVLARLELAGPAHRNPDGTEVSCPHLHVYREGFADKWAVVVPANKFPNTTDPWEALQDFMRYCNIVQAPNIRKGLFT
jgi:hypothetical protein